MNFSKRCSTLRTFSATALLLAAACGGDRMTAPGARGVPASDAARIISDGANSGNKDVWFLPPLVPNPSGKSGFGDAFQNGLPVVFKIVDLGAAGTPVIKTLTAVASPTDQLYQANWDTQNPVLNPDHNYRIEVWIGSRKPAFADVDVVSSGGLLKTVNSNEYIGLQDGRNLPLKVRVEKNWACINKASCVTEVVPRIIPVGEKFVVKANDQMNAVAFEGTWHDGDFPVLVTIENIAGQEGETNCASSLTIMRSTSSCIKFTADPPIVLTTSATVATCLANPGDDRQMVLKYDVGETAKFLEDVAPPIVCPEGSSMVSPNAGRAMRLASAAMNKVSKAFRWVTGTKAAYAIDLGVGGRLDVGDDFSYFTLGLPSSIEAVAGNSQTGVIGSVLPIAPAVRFVALHHHGDDPLYVAGLNVVCTVVGAGGSLVVGPSLVNAAGAVFNALDDTYTCPQWKMPNAAGTNTLRISSNKHDAQFYFPNGAGGYTLHQGTFDFTATSVLPLGVINSVSLTTSTLAIGGPGVAYTASITNPGLSLTGVYLQGEIVQGATTRGAGGGPDVDCGGTGIFAPGGPCTTGFTASASNTTGGTGTLVTGGATFRLQLIHGPTGTVLDTEDTPITLVDPGPSIVSVTLASSYLVIGGANVSYSAVLANSGSPLPGVFLQAWIDQGSASRAAGGGGDVNCGAGTGVLPTTASCNYSFSVSASNSGAGSGTLVPGGATLRFDMVSYNGVTSTVVATKLVPVTLVGPGLSIVSVNLSSSSVQLNGAGVSYTALLYNATAGSPAPVVLQAFITQGSANRAANGLQVICGAGTGVFPPGPCTLGFTYAASNSGAGSGTLVPGAATLVLQLIDNTSGSVVVDTKSLPITITP